MEAAPIQQPSLTFSLVQSQHVESSKSLAKSRLDIRECWKKVKLFYTAAWRLSSQKAGMLEIHSHFLPASTKTKISTTLQ